MGISRGLGLLSVLAAGASTLLLAVPAGADPTGADENCAQPINTKIAATPWPQQRLTPSQVWPTTRGGGVIVAVIDSGVDASVPQLRGHVLAGSDVADDGHTTGNIDCSGHGTFVAGVIAAQAAAGTAFMGVAPDAMILPIRQSGADSAGTVSGMAQAIRLAVDDGSRIINISSSAFDDAPVLAAAVRYAQAHNVLIVAAAANDAQQGNPVPYPAAYPGVLGVGAIGAGGARTDFSETGPFVALAAPGQAVVSLSRGGSGQTVGQGTSYATPFVSGTAALVWAAHPALSAVQVAHRLEATADAPGTRLPDSGLGWGVINPVRAVSAVLPEESGWKASSIGNRFLSMEPAPQPSPRPKQRAELMVIAGGSVVVAVALISWVIASGRHRRWQVPSGPDRSGLR